MKASPFPRILTTSIASLVFTTAAFAVDVTVNNSSIINNSAADYALTQGTNGWEYGYYNLTTDPNSTYEVSDFQYLSTGGWTNYSLIPGPPPYTAILNSTDGHPSTFNSQEMWTIRRYTVQPGEAGVLDGNWFLRKSDTAGGDGTSGAVYVNGALKDSGSVVGNDNVGFTKPISITANVGDKIDVVLKPNANDGNDSSAFGLRLNRNNFQTFTGLTLIADSIAEFSGVQGQNGWRYGWYNISTNGQPDVGGGDFIEMPANFWNGNYWDWTPGGNPPWTELTATGGHPNGTNNVDEHWVTKRYTVQPGEGGNLFIEWSLAKQNTGGPDGTTLRVMLNGVMKDAFAVDGADGTGVHRGFIVPGVQPGDLIDIALSPQGYQNFFFGTGDPANDGSDGSNFSAKIYLVPEPTTVGLLLASGAVMLGRRRRA